VAIEDDLDYIPHNPIASTIPKWRTFKLLRWMQNLHQSAWDLDILCNVKKTIFVKRSKIRTWREMKDKIHILFYGDSSTDGSG
jgi:hypothetical protein